MSNMVRYGEGTTFRGPSPQIWGDLSQWRAMADAGLGCLVFDDFLNWNTSTTNTTSYQNGWTIFHSDGPVITQVAAPDVAGGEFGAINANTFGEDDEAYVGLSNIGSPMKLDDTCRRLAYEVRFKKSAVTNSGLCVAFGVGLLGMVATGALTATTGVPVDSDWILWRQVAADGDAIGAFVKKTSQTAQTPLSANVAITADTYLKLGFVYEPRPKGGNCLRFYSNGVEQPLSANFVFADLDDADFPDNALVQPLILAMHEGVAAETLTVDWICCGQQW